MVSTNIMSLIAALSAVGAALLIGYAIQNDEHQDWKVKSDATTTVAVGVAVERSRRILAKTYDFIKNALSPSIATTSDCKESVDLEQFPQWREEVGYWIGELSLNGPGGLPFKSPDWNYPYAGYKGFITGNIKGGSYRQRNVFLYPPQTKENCIENNQSVVGDGTCGTNGNSKIYEADQSNVNNTIPSCDGTIEGPYAGVFHSKTTLVGNDNVLLYQVYYQGKLFQSQMTTLNGEGSRTRTAHVFNPFGPTPSVLTSYSFYRERRVEREEFYAKFSVALEEYGILDEDTCTHNSRGNRIEGIVGGIEACKDHLEQSFDLGDSSMFKVHSRNVGPNFVQGTSSK